MPPGIQRVVTKLIEDQIDTTRLNRLRAARDRLGLARTHAARAPLSAAWLVAIPDNPLLSMTSIQMKLAMRHRLGLYPSDNMPRICACGTRLGDNPYHYHSCTFLRRRHVTIRHNMVLDLMKRLVRESGGLALVEDHWRLHDWPDLEMFLRGGPGTGHIISDVSVSCPCAPSNRYTGRAILGCANARADQKRDRYAHLAQASGAANLPTVFESIGGTAGAMCILLRRLVQSYAVSPGALTPRAFSLPARQALSVCLQRGNALVDQAGLRHSARRSRHAYSDYSSPSASRRYSRRGHTAHRPRRRWVPDTRPSIPRI